MWENVPFIGRGEELAALQRMLAAMSADTPGLVLISGAAGIGKTRLLEQFASGAEAAGVRVLLGRAREDVRLPFGPFVEALREHREALLARGQPGAAHLREFLGVDPRRAARADPTNGGRRGLFLAVAESLLAAARDRPTVLAFDDLHWFDPDSLDLFEHVAFAALHPRTEAPFAIAASLREAEPGERLERAIARLTREARCLRLELDGFDESQTRDMIRAIGEGRPANRLVLRILRETGGNPLFVKETVRHLVRAGGLERRGGFLTAPAGDPELRLPADVTAAVRARVSRLSAPCRAALVTASLLGETFALATLASLLDDDEERLLGRLEEAESVGLVESRGQLFRFTHPLVRYVFDMQTGRARRERMHADVARRLEKLVAASESESIFAIAHHWLHAGSAADAPTRLLWARRAAERSVELFAWAEAARFFDAAACAADQCPDTSQVTRADLRYRAGYYFHRDWDAGPAVQSYGRALELYRRAGEARGVVQVLKELVRASLTLPVEELDPDADAEALERALVELGDRDPGLRARALDALAAHYWARRGGSARASELAGEAMAIARELRDDGLASEIAGIVALTHLSKLEVERALEVWQRGAEDARRAGDPHRAAQALFRVPMAELQLGRVEQALISARAACELDRALRNPEVSLTFVAEASAACLRGDLDAAEAKAVEALRLVRHSGYPWPRAGALGALACARAWRGDFAAARDAVALLTDPEWGVAEAARQRRPAQVLGLLVEALAGGAETLERGSHTQPPVMARAGSYDAALLPLFCAQVDCASLLARPELARGMRAALELARQHDLVFTLGWAFSVPRALGLAAASEGRRDEARVQLQRARELAEQTGARAEGARSALDLAQCLARDDPEAARELLREAVAEVRALGLWGLRRRALEIASELGVELEELAETRSATEDVSRDESSVLTQIALGRSDTEIARELALRPDTVAGRRGVALARIGASSHAEAMAWAVERGVGGAAAQVRATLEAFVGPAAERGALVIAVTDLKGSTAMLERLGDSAVRGILRTHNRSVRACVREHGGIEVQHTGDGFILAFQSPAAALDCAAALRRAFASYNRTREGRRAPLEVRIGLHAGHALPDEGRLVGLAMNTAARICNRAEPGQVLVSANVRRLLGRGVARFGPRRRVTLKGRSEPLALYALS